jgi:hypothetical protein
MVPWQDQGGMVEERVGRGLCDQVGAVVHTPEGDTIVVSMVGDIRLPLALPPVLRLVQPPPTVRPAIERSRSGMATATCSRVFAFAS